MGNRSTNGAPGGVPRTFVRLPGFYVRATICIPSAPPQALWLLAWVERLLQGASLAEVTDAPPWPVPPDPLVTRRVVRELIDLGWATPEWTTGGVVVAPHLADSFAREGRAGLARVLFDATTITGEWWMDGLGGALLARQTALQFDWDLQRRADVVLPDPADPQALLEAAEVDLPDLMVKLGRVEQVHDARDRAFLASPLALGNPKDIFFPLYGDAVRILPDELSELVPALERHAPELFGGRRAACARVVQLSRSPVERLCAEAERFPTDPLELGPIAPHRARVERLRALVLRHEQELASWLREGHRVWPVAGATPRHFDALAEMCAALGGASAGYVLLTSAFLNDANLAAPGGLIDALAAAPPDAVFVLVYGHASDDTPSQQREEMLRWQERLRERSPAVAGRLVLTAGRRRSHEKVVVTSAGDWMVGSWNPASSRPDATVFECSLRGSGAPFARSLAERVRANIEEPRALDAVAALLAALDRAPTATLPEEPATACVRLLRRAVEVLGAALPDDDGRHADAWGDAVRALRAALHPFLGRARLELIDEHQTRDAFVTHARAARRSVLLASDRLTGGALDDAVLRDLRGDRGRRTVRVVWGREWAGRRPTDPSSQEALRRAQEALGEARAALGPALRTDDRPMENHAKAVVVDGLRGLVTSENLLSYGGEKGRYESRELGVMFSSPLVARHLLGRFLLQWPDALSANEGRAEEVALPWVVACGEAWHALAPLREELSFDWQRPDYLGAVVRDELTEGAPDDDSLAARCDSLNTLALRIGGEPFAWLREQGERVGLIHASAAPRWCPYDAPEPERAEGLLAAAARKVAARTAVGAPEVRGGAPIAPALAVHPLVERVRANMIRVASGRFVMGDERVPVERPRHPVVISRPFLLGKTPVTQALWQQVMGELPHLRDTERDPEFPIVHVAYDDIQHFLERLNALPGSGCFELPTEAQWEYACRAGSNATYSFGDDPGRGDRSGPLERYAWTKRNAEARLRRVGQLAANAWGLFDMHGLVYETVRDGFRIYARAEVVDPVGPLGTGRTVARGGCWGRFPFDRGGRVENEHFRCASRQVHEKSHRVSFRLAWRLENQP